MEKTATRVTIRDIARQAGLSISTVHLALSGKAGPKEETRRHVLEIAEELNYQCNSVASSLKRGVTKIAAILPSLEEDNLLYYAPIWHGIRAYCESVKDFNIEFVEIPYINRDVVSVPLSAIIAAREVNKLSGLVVLGDIEPAAKKALRTISDQGIPIVLVNSDTPDVGRVCCVQAENYLLGRIMGEILLGRTPNGSSILACAGEPNTPANNESTRGLEDYLREYDPTRTLYKIYYRNDMEDLYRQLSEHFCQYDDIAGCCSVTARGSVQLAKVLLDLRKAGKMPAIGSDIFQANIDSLKSGIFQNLMFKNPFQQGWKAAENLFYYIFHGQPIEGSVICIKSEVVFQSSISMYE